MGLLAAPHRYYEVKDLLLSRWRCQLVAFVLKRWVGADCNLSDLFLRALFAGYQLMQIRGEFDGFPGLSAQGLAADGGGWGGPGDRSPFASSAGVVF